jgi:hypothetical protein
MAYPLCILTHSQIVSFTISRCDPDGKRSARTRQQRRVRCLWCLLETETCVCSLVAAIQNEKEKKGYFWTYADQDSRRVGEGSGGRGDLGGQAASEMKFSRSRDDMSAAGFAGRGQTLSCFEGSVAIGGFVSGRIKPGNRLLINCV